MKPNIVTKSAAYVVKYSDKICFNYGDNHFIRDCISLAHPIEVEHDSALVPNVVKL